jgi:hypothetical protein
VPANIDLMVTLPDGKVVARCDYPIDDETRSMTDSARQADEREWVSAHLSEMIELLYRRAGLELPDSKTRQLMTLLGSGVEHTPEVLAAVVGSHGLLRDVLHEVAAELGVDLEHRQVDSRTGVLSGAANLPRLAKQKVGDLRRARGSYDRLAAKVAKLAAAYPVARRLSGVEDHPLAVVDAALEALTHRAQQIDDRGRVIDAVKEAIGLGSPDVRDNLADAALPAAVTRALSQPEGGPDGQLAANLLALYRLPQDTGDNNANAIFMAIAGARDAELAKVRGEDRYEEGRREAQAEMLRMFQLTASEDDTPVEQLLALYARQRRMGQTDVLGALGVDTSELPADAELPQWGPRAREAWFTEAREPLQAELDVTRAYLALVLKDLRLVGDDHFQQVRTGELHPDVLAGLARQAQGAVADLHKVHAQMIELLDHFDLDRATPDSRLAEAIVDAAAQRLVEKGALRHEMDKALRHEMDKILILFNLPQDTSVVEVSRRISEQLRPERADAEVLRTALSSAGELAQAVSPMEGAALREGKVTGGQLVSMAREVQAKLVHRHGELAVLRNFAFEVAQAAGVSLKDSAVLTTGELRPQELANRLRPIKAELRRGGAGVELATSNRIIADIAAKLGQPELRSTLVPGAVGDLLACAEHGEGIIREVQAVLSELPGWEACDDDQLPERLRNLVQLRPGEFYTAEGLRAKQLRLPEDGLADILAKVRPPKLPKLDLDAFNGSADKVVERVEAWGERLAARFNDAAVRLAAEVGEAVEKARKDGDQ